MGLCLRGGFTTSRRAPHRNSDTTGGLIRAIHTASSSGLSRGPLMKICRGMKGPRDEPEDDEIDSADLPRRAFYRAGHGRDT